MHPTPGEKIEFVAPLFPDMKDFIDNKFNQGEINEKINPHIIDSHFTTITERL
jgi:23S rRNA pseudouridine1911/1915/1917 synthase